MYFCAVISDFLQHQSTFLELSLLVYCCVCMYVPLSFRTFATVFLSCFICIRICVRTLVCVCARVHLREFKFAAIVHGVVVASVRAFFRVYTRAIKYSQLTPSLLAKGNPYRIPSCRLCDRPSLVLDGYMHVCTYVFIFVCTYICTYLGEYFSFKFSFHLESLRFVGALSGCNALVLFNTLCQGLHSE